ncbi:MAG: hypothetical protein KF718_24885 [Polyangiaceae bacterium]|nr:hypothetical protein [Polyangiaceae bacterium]
MRTHFGWLAAVLVVACGGSEFSSNGSATGGSAGSGASSSGGSSASGGASGSSGAGAVSGSAGQAGSAGAGGTVSYPETVCDVPTHQSAAVQAPSCSPTTLGCVADFSGVFGEPGEADGSASNARFVGLYGLIGEGDYLYASTAHAIRRVHIETGAVTTLAGNGEAGHFDGSAAESRFACPRGLAILGGELYVADAGNGRVRRVNLNTGAVTTVASNLQDPAHLAAREGNVIVTELGANRISQINLSSSLVTHWGAGTPPYSQPHGLAWTNVFNLFYLADAGNHVLRKADANGSGAAQVGQIGAAGHVNAQGTQARLSSPRGTSVKQPDLIFVADHGNHAIRRAVAGSYQVSPVAGGSTSTHAVGVGTSAGIVSPTDVHFQAHSGREWLFIAEGTVIRRMELAP